MKQVGTTKVWVALGVLFQALSMLIVYKVVTYNYGADAGGTWAYVMAISGAAKLADCGVPLVLPGYVAKSGFSKKVDLYVISGAFITLVSSVCVSFCIYAAFSSWGERVVGQASYDLALWMLQFSLFAFVIQTLSSVFLFSLDGFGRSRTRVILSFIGVTVYTCLSFIFSFVFDSVSCIVYAYLISTCVLYLLAFYNYKKLPLVKGVRTPRKLVWAGKRLFSTSFKMQLISLLSIFGEILTKSLISSYSGLANVLYYEMATKLVSQIRSIAVSVSQLIVPSVAAEIKDGNGRSYFEVELLNALKLTLLFSFFGMATLILFSPVIEFFWGVGNSEFIVTVMLLAVVNFVVIPSAPIYFLNIGKGDISPNLYSQLIISGLNIVLGVALGRMYGYWGVVSSISIAIFSGTLFLYFDYFSNNVVSYFYKGLKWLLLLLITLMVLASIVCLSSKSGFWMLLMFIVMVIFLVFSMIFYRHSKNRGIKLYDLLSF